MRRYAGLAMAFATVLALVATLALGSAAQAQTGQRDPLLATLKSRGFLICGVRHVGNYGESFEANLGQGSPLRLARGRNALWTKGGMHYAPPIR